MQIVRSEVRWALSVPKGPSSGLVVCKFYKKNYFFSLQVVLYTYTDNLVQPDILRWTQTRWRRHFEARILHIISLVSYYSNRQCRIKSQSLLVSVDWTRGIICASRACGPGFETNLLKFLYKISFFSVQVF